MTDIAYDVTKELLKELRAKRRWSIFFKLIFIGFFIAIILTSFSTTPINKLFDKPHTAVIDIQDEITEATIANTENITASLKLAFENKAAKGVILKINSPGGTTVTADNIYQKIQSLKKLYPNKKIYTVCVDACTSGAYYIAAATDAIYANPASIVGSVAVLYNGFGFVETMNKLGVERRLYTGGENKAFMDPFSPTNPLHVESLKNMLNEIHELFISRVKEGRKTKLKNDPLIFSGSIWTGNKAKDLGLIDGFGNVEYVAKEIIKEEKLFNYTLKPNYFEKMGKYLVQAPKISFDSIEKFLVFLKSFNTQQ